MKADLYIRVSTDEQAEKGYSQRDQEERLRKYCDFKRISIRKVIYEDYSAKSFNRPAWKEFLGEIKSRKKLVDFVLFTKWDRFSRNAADAFQMINTLRRYDVEPCAIEQPLDLDIPENKIMLGIYLTAPEVENDRRSLNVRYGMRRAVKEGRWMNYAPLGYLNRCTPEGKKYIAINPPDAALIKWSFEAIAQRQTYVEHIYREAKSKGIKCGKNQFWNILRNPVYCGKILLKGYKDEPACLIQGNHEPIISEQLFMDVQDALDHKRKSRRTSTMTKDELVLRGFMLCPSCKRMLTGSASKGRKIKYYYYHCIYPCKTRFKAETTNQLFFKQLMKFSPKPGMAELYAELINSIYKKAEGVTSESRSELNDKIVGFQERIAKSREKFVNDEITRSEYAEDKAKYEKQIDLLEIQLHELTKTRPDIKKDVLKAIENLSRLPECYQGLNSDHKRRLIGSIFPQKFTFDGDSFRTARLNQAVELIFNVGKHFRQKKSGQNSLKTDLSTVVNRIGFEPMTYCLEGSCSIQLSYRSLIVLILRRVNFSEPQNKEKNISSSNQMTFYSASLKTPYFAAKDCLHEL